ncbi:MAG TPA: aldo/keto reductase, partial [Pirellulales bacterium]|nr:aldo/keto reductase [Pirellulales bacterium]
MTAAAHLRLSSGAALPSVGLGLWKVAGADTAEMVGKAVQAGYRHFDCACDYGNEAEVGTGLQRAIGAGWCRREELWITSKLWTTFHRPEHVRLAVERSLRDLRLDYLDLYLVHFPIALEFVPPEKRYPPGWFADPDAPDPRMKFAAVPLVETWGAMEGLVDAGLVKHLGVCNYNCALLRDLLNGCRIRPEVLQV